MVPGGHFSLDKEGGDDEMAEASTAANNAGPPKSSLEDDYGNEIIEKGKQK